jgi:hypothetical protein
MRWRCAPAAEKRNTPRVSTAFSARPQATSESRMRYSVTRSMAISPGAELCLHLGVAQRLAGIVQRLQHAHPAARHLDAGGTQEIGGG